MRESISGDQAIVFKNDSGSMGHSPAGNTPDWDLELQSPFLALRGAADSPGVQGDVGGEAIRCGGA